MVVPDRCDDVDLKEDTRQPFRQLRNRSNGTLIKFAN